MPKTSLSVPAGFAFSAGGSIELRAGDAGLTIDSAEDKVSFMGDFDITRDARGLALAQSLSQLLDGALLVLKTDKAAGRLPDVLSLLAPTVHQNPFA
jgi:hypothetical protein